MSWQKRSVIVAMLAPYAVLVNREMSKVIGGIALPLKKKIPDCTSGNLMADVMKREAEKLYGVKVDTAFINYGGIRSNQVPAVKVRNGLIDYFGAILTGDAILPQARAYETVLRLIVLHTNDLLSRLEPFLMDGGCNHGLGGVAARADIFQGTTFFNFYKGETEIRAMAAMGYDA